MSVEDFKRRRRERLKVAGKTDAEIDAIERQVNEFMDEVLKARKAIVEHTGGKRGIAGIIKCPVCGADNSLRFTVAVFNSHIHAQCGTAGCVAWME